MPGPNSASYWWQEAQSRTLLGSAVLLLCSSCCQGITHYLYLQLKTDMQLCLDIYMQSLLFLLVLELTVWIMFYYYKKLSLADKVFTWSLTVCIRGSGTTGSSQLKDLQSLEEMRNPLPSMEPNCWCLVYYDQITCLSIWFGSVQVLLTVKRSKLHVWALLNSRHRLCYSLYLFAAGHFTPWPISNQGGRKGIEDNRA